MLEPLHWAAEAAAAKGAGFEWFELLSAFDDAGRSGRIVVFLRLRDQAGHVRELTTSVERGGVLPDISGVFAGAAWGQRYVHDFYGVGFAGADLSALLNHEGGAPLLKTTVAAARHRRRRR